MPEHDIDWICSRTGRRTRWWTTGVALIALLVADPVSGQNLLVNSEFDENIEGWACEGEGTTCGWSEDDPVDDPASGSGQVTREGAGSFRGQIAQCVELPAPGLYEIAGVLRTISEDLRNGQLEVSWFPEPGCAGTRLGLADVVAAVPTAFGWTLLEATLPAPEAAVSLEYTVVAFATETESQTVRIDAAFVPEPGATVAGIAAGTALLGLHARKRARRKERAPATW